MSDAICAESNDSNDKNHTSLAEGDSISPRNDIPQSLSLDIDFLSLLTGVKADGSSIYASEHSKQSEQPNQYNQSNQSNREYESIAYQGASNNAYSNNTYPNNAELSASSVATTNTTNPVNTANPDSYESSINSESNSESQYKTNYENQKNSEESTTSEEPTKKRKHHLWHFGSRNSQKNQESKEDKNSKNSKDAKDSQKTNGDDTPHFTVLPTAPSSEEKLGIFDNRDGQVFDSATRLRLHTLIATCLMNGIADQRVSALMHLLQWPNNPKIIVIAGTYGAAKKKDNGPTRRVVTHETPNNTDTLRRTIWPMLSSCNAYDAIVESVQSDAIERIASAWNINSIVHSKEEKNKSKSKNDNSNFENNGFASPSHIVILAIREDPPKQALEKLCSIFEPSKKPIVISSIAKSVSQVSSAITATLASLAVAPSVNHLPNIIHTDDVLPERALIGDSSAIDTLYTSVYQSLAPYSEDDPTLSTIDMFLRFGGALDQTAHELNVHPNTVRYRLRKVAQTTGWDATDPRAAYVLQTAITIGRIRDSH